MPLSGRYFVGDVDVLNLSFNEFLPYRFAFGYSFDTFGLLSNRTIRDNLLLPLLFHGHCSESEACDRVDQWMQRFRIDVCAAKRTFAVTGGQRKSAVLLRSLLHRPQIAFLDDPMAGLTEDGRAAFADLIDDAFRFHGLKQIVFCAERELPIHGRVSKSITIHPRQMREAEAA